MQSLLICCFFAAVSLIGIRAAIKGHDCRNQILGDGNSGPF
jgi:hypothetical protein